MSEDAQTTVITPVRISSSTVTRKQLRQQVNEQRRFARTVFHIMLAISSMYAVGGIVFTFLATTLIGLRILLTVVFVIAACCSVIPSTVYAFHSSVG